LTTAATAFLREKIIWGKINPNIQTASYLGDVVSGEHFPDYEAPPPTGCQTAIVRVCRLFRRIMLEKEFQGRRDSARGGEVGKNLSFLLISLFYMCAQPDFIIIHAEEGSDNSNNKGGDKDKDEEGNKDEEEDEGDEDEDREMSSRRAPAATKAEKKPRATPKKCSPNKMTKSLNRKRLQLLLLTCLRLILFMLG
jgi:hypothetical protein